MAAALPNLDHLTYLDFQHVYEPSEDTYLLCDTIKQFKNEIISVRPRIILEIGSGSGCVITFIVKLLKDCGVSVHGMSTDINPKAIAATRGTASQNDVVVDPVLMDLGSAWCDARIDVLIFNPPYVPTPSEEISGNDIEASWAGGIDGREVINRFLPSIKRLLSPTGMCLLLLVRENKPQEVMEILSKYSLSSKIIQRTQAKNEHLMILQITHQSQGDS